MDSRQRRVRVSAWVCVCVCVCVDPWHLIKIYISSVSYIWRGKVLCTLPRYLYSCFIIASGLMGAGCVLFGPNSSGTKTWKKDVIFFSYTLVSAQRYHHYYYYDDGGDDAVRSIRKSARRSTNPIPRWDRFQFVIGAAHSTRKIRLKHNHLHTTVLL